MLTNNNRITILVDNDSWILPYASRLEKGLSEMNYSVNFVRKYTEIKDGWVCFLLGCTRIIPKDILQRNQHNLVVHESDLPRGRGFAPMTWQILEGRNSIPVCLIEAAEEADTGEIWLKDVIELGGYELHDEWRKLQGDKTIELCLRFVREFQELSPKEQKGEGFVYPRRYPEYSRINISKNIEEQFNLLRVVDNEKYPAFIEIHGCRYILRITREKM